MTYRELYESATRKLEKSEITFGEYEEMTKPLNEDVRTWIPVSERLPENRNQEVLISLEWGIDIGRYIDGEWQSEWINRFDDGNVLAWMPLPKPYKPQEGAIRNEI